MLLAQSSDWAFMIHSGTMGDYATQRIETHLANFTRLKNDLRHGRIDEDWLCQLEARHNILREIDFRWFGREKC